MLLEFSNGCVRVNSFAKPAVALAFMPTIMPAMHQPPATVLQSVNTISFEFQSLRFLV